MNGKFAATLLEALGAAAATGAADAGLQDVEPAQDARPTPEQKALLDRLTKTVDARAAELQVSAEVLAPRGELKGLAMGTLARSPRSTRVLTGWRLQEIGTRLLALLA
jgi:ribonuclease D